MIDIENELFDACVTAVEVGYPGIVATSKNLSAPAEFPAISIVESNNTTDENRRDSSGVERGSILTYDIKVFSNLREGAKAQAKKIAQLADAFMVKNNFRRTFYVQGETTNDSSVYQVSTRYIAGVTNTGRLYRR